jgi:hypothetical protein
VADRYFSPEEVEALIPELTLIVGELMEKHAEADGLRERVHEERARLAMIGGGVPTASWRQDAARLERLAGEIQERLRRIAELGGVMKDLGTGLVDFPYLRAGRHVNLCWRHGERRVAFWHGLDEGFAGRKPL